MKQRLLRVEHPQVCTRVNRLWKTSWDVAATFEVLLSSAASRVPNHLSEVSLWEFYKAINKVERSFITDADEVTYNLHVMIRFDLSYRC